jgi:antitoxin component of MazEF toxin-antitoxin module
MKIRKWSDIVRRRYSDEQIAKFRADAAMSLADQSTPGLLVKIMPDNIHGETDMGEPVGNEHW